MKRHVLKSAVRLGTVVAIAAFGALAGSAAQAAEARVAVAANFTAAAKEIGAAFEKASGHKLILSFGASGQFYTQITQSAPFDVFLSADQDRPRDAVKAGLAVPSSVFAYATGRLVLFSKDKGVVNGEATLKTGKFNKIAIANPKAAPYGAAAIEVMKAVGVYDALQPKIVQGNNIAQAFQFVDTKSAELGFVALSQVIQRDEGSRWIVPEKLHTIIAQDAVLLKRGEKNEAATAFLAFLKGPAARSVIEKYGYGFGK